MAELVSIEEALAAILERAQRLEAETVPIGDSHGRIAAADTTATVDLPPFPSSAMDGFALRAADAPGEPLPVVARVAAGRPADRPLDPGTAMGIATGGVVPSGADAVVPIENVVEHDNSIEIQSDVAEGDNVRPAGSDIAFGTVVVPAGARIGAAAVAALAASGAAEVSCAKRPLVSVLSTGTELMAPGAILGPGQIYESNGVMLDVALSSAGAVVERLSPVADDESAHRDAIASGLGSDVLVTTGGVSVGPHDLVRTVAASLGVEEVFWGVAMRPGKPLFFGVRGRTLVFGLPGNPVSALVAVELFVKPALRALQGHTSPTPAWLPGRLGRSLPRNTNRDDLVRAVSRVDGEHVTLEPITGQESHMISRAARANALAHVPRGRGELEAGAAVSYLPLD